MRSLNTKKVSVYLINSDVVKTEILDNDDKYGDEINNDIIVRYLSNKLRCNGYITKEENNYRKYKTTLLFKSTPTNRKSNNNFFEPILKNKNLFDNTVQDNKAIVFVYNDCNIFVITVGSSYGNISPYIDDYFGIKILGKVISPSKFEVYSQKTQSVTGYEKLNNSSYRNGCSLLTVKQIENVLKEIGGKIDKDVLPRELQSISEKNMVTVNAKSSISFGNKINFDQAVMIMDWANEVLRNSNKNIILNGMEILKKKSKVYYQYLDRVKKELWYYYNNRNIDTNNKYDLINKEPEDYLKAYKYQIKYNGDILIESNEELTVSEFLNNLEDDLSQEEFFKILEKSRIVAFDYENEILTDDTLINHLSGEIPFVNGDNTNIIIMDGEIIKLNRDYIENINENLKYRIKDRLYNNSILTNWGNSKDETEYIKKHFSSGALIIHPKKPQNIELCDILIKNGERYEMIFIKQGYDYNVRDLVSQIKISKQLLLENKFDEYIEKLFTNLKRDCNTNVENYNKEDIIFQLKNKNVTFVFAIYDGKSYSLEEQEKYESSIAKISLDDLIGDFNKSSYTLKIYKIKK